MLTAWAEPCLPGCRCDRHPRSSSCAAPPLSPGAGASPRWRGALRRVRRAPAPCLRPPPTPGHTASARCRATPLHPQRRRPGLPRSPLRRLPLPWSSSTCGSAGGAGRRRQGWRCGCARRRRGAGRVCGSGCCGAAGRGGRHEGEGMARPCRWGVEKTPFNGTAPERSCAARKKYLTYRKVLLRYPQKISHLPQEFLRCPQEFLRCPPLDGGWLCAYRKNSCAARKNRWAEQSRGCSVGK